MKLNDIKRIIVLLFMTYGCGQLAAQQTNTLYFMQGVSERSIYNPAFQSPYDFYLDLFNIGLNAGNNSLFFNDVIFNKNNQTIHFLHPDAGNKRADFYNALKNTTRFNGGFSVNSILGLGLRSDKSYFTFDVTVKGEADAYLPKDLFKLGMFGTKGQSDFNLNKFGLNASVYTEVALGYSRQLNEKLTVGAKLKYLAGIANVGTDIKKLKMAPGPDGWGDKWVIEGDGKINASIPKAIMNRDLIFKQDPNNPNREIIDFDNIGDAINDNLGSKDFFKADNFFNNPGFGADLGVTYKVLPNLQLSAAVLNLGFISWNNTVNAEIKDGYTFDGFEYIIGNTWKGKEDEAGNIIPGTSIKQKLEDEADKLKGLFENKNIGGAKGKAYKTLLSPRLNVGAEYGLLNDKVGIGLLYSGLYANKEIYPSLTASLNLRPCDQVHPTVSYSVLDGGFKSIGFGAQFKLSVVNLYFAVDKIPVGSKSYAKRYEGVPIPQYINGTNIHVGMSLAFGDSRSWKNKDDDRDGVKNKKDRCPDTPYGWPVDKFGCHFDEDGDGVPDHLDKCPGTPAGVQVDSKGCPIDSDGDGVPDYLDRCPGTPAGVEVDDFGCPIDSDGDGVPDYLDECPGTPAGVRVDSKGCPIDSDGDGVPDYLDKCPGTPAGVKVDKNGCPIDSDGDGVPDYLDKCPNVPGPVWNDGCPEPKPELKAKEKAVFEKALHGIQFATGKADITKVSYKILDDIVQIMKENPTYYLTINGHTDNVGKPESNQVLSEKRAGAVRDYLIMQGIERDRVKSQGFGDTQPVVPNTTAANKAENRRVEFIVKYEKEID